MGNLLTDFLSRNKKNEETISKTLNKNLLIVEAEIARRKRNVSAARKTIKENAINIKALSEATGIARKTFYNNELLAEFVEENAYVDEPREEAKRLRARLSDSDSKLMKMLNRDVDTEILRHQIDKLQTELEISHKRIIALEEQHEEDLRKLNHPVVKKKQFFDA